MANRKNKDDGTKSSKGMDSSSKGSTTAMIDSSGLRRSARETPSKKKIIPCPSSTRKSERLEKQTPTTPSVKKKSERVETQRTPSPPRRSLRAKNQHTSRSSETMKSDKSPVSSEMTRKKERREKSVKPLTVDASEFSKSGKQGLKPFRVENKRMDARTYRRIFLRQKKSDNAAGN